MSIAFAIDVKENIVVTTWLGPTTYEQWMENMQRLNSDPGFSKTNRFLVDFRLGAVDESVQDSQLATGATVLFSMGSYDSPRKIAVVAGEKAYDRLKTFERLVTPSFISFIVFNHMSSACSWLGVGQELVETKVRGLLEKLRT